MNTSRILVLLLVLFISGTSTLFAQKNWYKGNLHTHSLWSDGDDFPEMIMDWYKSNGYHFVSLSDHNILAEGIKWIYVPRNTSKEQAFEKYLKKYGKPWVEFFENKDSNETL